MALAYIPPSVSIEELSSPSVNSILASVSTVCLVGLARGYQEGTQLVDIPADAGSTLSGAHTNTVTTLTLVSTTQFASTGGVARIDAAGANELVTYTGKTGTTLTGVRRGAYGTTAAAHATGVTIAAVAIVSAPVDSSISSVGTTTFEEVRNFNSAISYTEGTDFTVAWTATTGANAYKYAIITPTGFTAQTRVSVKYRHLPSNYFVATRCFDQGTVEELYGPALDGDSIGSVVSFAASKVFENGADSVVIQPLFRRTTATDPDSVRLQPVVATPGTTGSAASTVQWENTLYALRDVEDIGIIVPVIGQSFVDAAGAALVSNDQLESIHLKVVDHIRYMKDNSQYLIGVFGADGTRAATDAPAATLRTDLAPTLAASQGGQVTEQCVLVSPAKFSQPSPNNSFTEILLGGQYVAAAVAGMLSSRPTFLPLTRKPVAGFSRVVDVRDRLGKDADAEAGMLVIENKGRLVQVRHSITLDSTNTATRELSVVRAKHRMLESLYRTIDEQIIGNVVADGNAPHIVKTTVISVLEDLRAGRELVDYQDVQARQLSLDPTTVEVRFNYRPAFPLNYVKVQFSLNLTTGVDTTRVTGAV